MSGFEKFCWILGTVVLGILTGTLIYEAYVWYEVSRIIEKIAAGG